MTRGALLCLLFAACSHGAPSPRTLHYIGDDLVTTPVVDHRAYGAYVQAQLALGLQAVPGSPGR